MIEGPPVRIRILGALQIVLGEDVVPFVAPPRTGPLLGYLALHRALPISRERVAFALWPDAPEGEARANLRRHLHYLERALPNVGSPWIVRPRKPLVQWNVELARVLDVAEFEQSSASPETRREAIALYGGDLLDAFDEEWLLYERDRLRQLQTSNLDWALAQSVDADDAVKIIEGARRVLAHDAFREDAVRLAIQARRRTGDRAGALAEYRRFAERLHADLGVEPMPETRACHEAILADQHLTGPPLGARDSGDRPLPFVGRAGQLAILRAKWSHALQGKGGLILIGGQAGLGKTRLTQELAGAVASPGLTLVGHTNFPETIPYQPLADALRQAHIDPHTVDRITRSTLSPLVPDLRLRSDGVDLPALSGEAARERFFEALYSAFVALSNPTPVLLILEDLHWASRATLAALDGLVRRLATRPILFVGTYREDEIDGAHPLRFLRRRFAGDPSFTHIPLNPLDLGAVESLVAQLAAGESAQHTLADYLYVQSEGNPLFLGEVLRDAFEADSLGIDGGQWRVGALHQPDIPRGVRTTILDRLGRLSHEAYALAETAAAIGGGFDADLLAAVNGWSEATVAATCDELLDRQIVRDFGRRGRAEFTFSHHLIQLALYESAGEKNLQARHRRIARALMERASSRGEDFAATIAHHFDRAGDATEAARHYEMGAAAALRVADTEAAIRLTTRGLELAVDPGARRSLLFVREEALRRSGQREAQGRDLQELLALVRGPAASAAGCEVQRRRYAFASEANDYANMASASNQLEDAARSLGHADWIGRAQLIRARYLLIAGRKTEGIPLLEQALVSFDREGTLEDRVDAHLLFAYYAAREGQHALASDHLNRADALGDASRDLNLRLRVGLGMTDACYFSDDFPQLSVQSRRLLASCEAAGDRFRAVSAHLGIASAATNLFEYRESSEQLEAAHTIASELAVPRHLFNVLQSRVFHRLRFGAFEDGLSGARDCLVLAEQLGFRSGQFIALFLESALLWSQGDFERAKAVASASLPLADRVEARRFYSMGVGLLGKCELLLGNIAAALEHLQQALALARETQSGLRFFDTAPPLALAYLRLGRIDEAAKLASEMLAAIRQRDTRMLDPQLCLLASGQVRRALGEATEADEALKRARQLLAERALTIPNESNRKAMLAAPFHSELLAGFDDNVRMRLATGVREMSRSPPR